MPVLMPVLVGFQGYLAVVLGLTEKAENAMPLLCVCLTLLCRELKTHEHFIYIYAYIW